jgi:hypothetical protein
MINKDPSKKSRTSQKVSQTPVSLRERNPVQLGKAFRRFRVLREVLGNERLLLS